MSPELAARAERLRADFEDVSGTSSQHFYCPVLFTAEVTILCKAHLINQGFKNASRKWTVQRADVDNFFGSVFESQFLDLRYRGKSVEQFFDDPSSVKELRPQLYIEGEKVDHYLPKGKLPEGHTEIQIRNLTGVVRLALKTKVTTLPEGRNPILEVAIERDCRMSALVSVLKTAHLTLFHMLGYRYALSPGGIFLGSDVLGTFFRANQGLAKKQVLLNAETHFPQFANLVRPIMNPQIVRGDTIHDQVLYFCEGFGQWGFLLYVRTDDAVHAVIVPVIETPDAASSFVHFLHAKGQKLHVREARFEKDTFFVSPIMEELFWPDSAFYS